MKVEQDAFRPVVITLETKEEVEALYQIANHHMVLRHRINAAAVCLTHAHCDLLYNEREPRGSDLYTQLGKCR